MPSRPRILFLCTANSCRSQMAEGWLRELAGERFEALSAGTHPSHVHPDAARVMAEVGVDLGVQRSKSIDEFTAAPPELVITVCDRAAEACPVLPAATRVLHWPFPDPAGGDLDAFRSVRDAIGARLRGWLVDPDHPTGQDRQGHRRRQARDARLRPAPGRRLVDGLDDQARRADRLRGDGHPGVQGRRDRLGRGRCGAPGLRGPRPDLFRQRQNERPLPGLHPARPTTRGAPRAA